LKNGWQKAHYIANFHNSVEYDTIIRTTTVIGGALEIPGAIYCQAG
jgi:hypothetical protein